jgi:hypothetical protein
MRPFQILFLALLLGGALRPELARAQSGSSGTIITIAGNSTGPSTDGEAATNGALGGPVGLAVGPSGTLFLYEEGTSRFRAINPTNGIINTIATVSAYPGIGLGRTRNRLYFSDPDDNVIHLVGNFRVKY